MDSPQPPRHISRREQTQEAARMELRRLRDDPWTPLLADVQLLAGVLALDPNMTGAQAQRAADTALRWAHAHPESAARKAAEAPEPQPGATGNVFRQLLRDVTGL